MKYWIEWEENTTDAGIKLQGVTKVKKRGELINVSPILINSNITMFVSAKVGDELVVFSNPFKFVEGPDAV